jgi:hypothetical protein
MGNRLFVQQPKLLGILLISSHHNRQATRTQMTTKTRTQTVSLFMQQPKLLGIVDFIPSQ